MTNVDIRYSELLLTTRARDVPVWTRDPGQVLTSKCLGRYPKGGTTEGVWAQEALCTGLR